MKFIAILASISILQTSIAQNTRIIYEVTSQGEAKEAYLLFNDTMSVFKIENNDNSMDLYGSYFQKNKTEGFAYFNKRFMNVEFHVKDSLHLFDWELTADTAIILGWKCNTAKTFYRGRSYVVYYAPDLFDSEGPWKFGGLPGLILMARSTDHFVEWKATGIKFNVTDPVTMKATSKLSVLPWSDFVTKYKSTVEKFIKLSKSNGTISDGSTAVMKISSVEIFYPELQTGKGITF